MPGPVFNPRSPIGRFAPTPSGPLHYGSIVAALGSYLDARHQGGRWLVRMEDIDPPRVRPNADTLILSALETLGLHWDGEVLYQSSRLPAYAEAMEQLRARGLVYACACKRKDVSGRPYPGTCRTKQFHSAVRISLRLRATTGNVSFNDAIQGTFTQNIADETGDFIVRRSDGLTAYHLAVVVDDHWQGVTQVVRGADLMSATPAQICVQKALGIPAPEYAHLPTVVDANGKKISKSLSAEAVLLKTQPGTLLLSVLRFLGQDPDPELEGYEVHDILAWATLHWRRAGVSKERQLQVTSHKINSP